MRLVITDRDVDEVRVVNLDGRVVFGAEANALRDKVNMLISSGSKKLVLNVNNVTFIDSAGLGALVSVHHAANSSGGALRLCHIGTNFNEMLRITKMNTVFQISDTENDAVRALAQ